MSMFVFFYVGYAIMLYTCKSNLQSKPDKVFQCQKGLVHPAKHAWSVFKLPLKLEILKLKILNILYESDKKNEYY